MKKILMLAALLSIAMINSECKQKKQTTEPPPTNPTGFPPDPIEGSINLEYVDEGPGSINGYNCNSGTPGKLVNSGQGCFVGKVLGTNAPNFSLTYRMDDPSTFFMPVITPQNNTQTQNSNCNCIVNGINPTDPDIFNFSAPISGAWQLKMYYIEYTSYAPPIAVHPMNMSNCTSPIDPITNQPGCYRWCIIMTLASGSIPNSAYSMIAIDVQDGTGFVGACN